jgi:hypothetical protein
MSKGWRRRLERTQEAAARFRSGARLGLGQGHGLGMLGPGGL